METRINQEKNNLANYKNVELESSIDANDLNININEKRSYLERLNKGVRINLFICMLLFTLLFLAKDNFIFPLLASSFLFLVQLEKSIRFNKYLIYGVLVKKNILEIEFDEKGINKMIREDVNSLTIKKKSVFSLYSKTVYLEVKENDLLIVRQYNIGGWDERKFDEIINTIQKHVQ